MYDVDSAGDMSTPITTRLDDETAALLDRIVQTGGAPSRSAIVGEAVREWLQRHSEAAVVESYRRAYTGPDPEEERLIAAMGTFAVAAAGE